jgi:hypothetical protein
MIDPWNIEDLAPREQMVLVRRQTLAAIAAIHASYDYEDRRIRAWIDGVPFGEPEPPSERELVAAAAIADLETLGVPEPGLHWRAGVLASRIWLLRLASEIGDRDDQPAWNPGDQNSAWAQWQIWFFVWRIAGSIRDDRRKRRFGPEDVTAGDLDVARLELNISNDRWIATRTRADWVLRP